MNLARAFAKSTHSHADKTAIFWGNDEVHYRELWSQTLWVARQLRSQVGVQPGDRVGIWLKNCPQFIPALFGILQMGGVVVPINSFLKPAEVEFILADAGINVLIIDETMPEYFETLRAKMPGLQSLRVENFGSEAADADASALESKLAVIIYTSGTTGKPKGAMLSHENLWDNVQSCRIMLEAVGEDRFVVLLPMFHSFMLTVGLLLPLLIGGSIVLVKMLHPPKNVVMEIIQHRATLLPAVPQFFRALTHPSVRADLPLRICISGGAPLPAEILKDFNARFTIPLLEGYGLSEASPVVSFNPIKGPWKAGSIGVPIHGVEVSVQNDAGEILPPNEIGEICVRGSNVMLGYWNQPEETAKAMRADWLLTGDVGYGDADGYFYITDRKKDMLLVNGINVYPREIEEVLYKYPGVKEVAVIGLPDARKGEQPLAFVAPHEGATLEEAAMLKFIRQQLADYKVPRQIVLLPALPRNATGKVLKTELRRASGGCSFTS